MKFQIPWPLLAAASAVALGSCTVGDDYARPDVSAQLPSSFDLPAGWKVAQPRDDEGGSAWWIAFNDSQLNRLMASAAANNQELKAAFARVEQARAIAGTARSERQPELDFSPAASRQRRSGTASSNFGNTAGRTTTTLSLPFQMQYEVDLWGRLRRAVQAADFDAQASESALRQVLLTLRAELAANYFNLRSLDAEIEIFRSAIELRRKSRDLNQLRFDAGDSDEVDVSRAKTELASTEAELAALKRTRSDFEDAIAVLVGEPSSGFAIASRPLTSAPPRIPVTVPSELLERRPDVARAERLMAAENARIGVARAAFYPTVGLSANAGLESASASDLFKIASRTWGLGPRISLPVLDGGRNETELQRALARYDETVADYRQTILEAVSEVDRTLAGAALLAEQAAAQTRTVESASRTVELSEERYAAGVVDYFEVVDAQRTLLDAEQQAARVTGARHVAAVTLARALGGAW